MTTYLSVTPGIDMSQALGTARLTKKWLRDYLRDNPQKDFRNHTGAGAYVNGEDCIRQDLSLEVYDSGHRLVACVDFQSTNANDWGYQAVVR